MDDQEMQIPDANFDEKLATDIATAKAIGGKIDKVKLQAATGSQPLSLQQRLLEIQKNFKDKTLRGRNMLSKITDMVLRGANKASQHNIIESLKIDDEWIINIEGCIKYINNIVRNPKSALIDNRIIVNTSKAKKTDSETIRYLSSHTSDIESIQDGEIRPSRLNVREMDTDFATYENRFVYALMVRLRAFLEQRYIAIKEQINCFDANHLKVESSFDTPNGDVAFAMDIKIRDKMSDSLSVRENWELLERIESCRMHISMLMGSEFARILAKSKLLMPPINKTNVLRVHPDYKGCYNLWMFISAYTSVGYSVSVDEMDMDIQNDYYDDLAFIIAMTVKNMSDNSLIHNTVLGGGKIKKRIKRFKPVKSFSYTPTRRTVAKKSDIEFINQHYFEKLKKLLKECDTVKAKKDEPLMVAFRAYFKSVRALNDKLYSDALEFDNFRKPFRSNKSLAVKKQQLADANEARKRFKLLRTLKESDFNAIKKEEKKFYDRAEKLKKQIKILDEKRKQEEIRKREEKRKLMLKMKEEKRLMQIEKRRIAEEKRVAAAAEKLRQKQLTQEKKQAEKVLAAQKRVQERKRELLKKQEALQREKLRKQKEKQKQQEKLLKQKEREKQQEKLRKQKERERAQERLRKQKEQKKAQEKLRKQKEQEKLRMQKEREKEQEKLRKQKEQGGGSAKQSGKPNPRAGASKTRQVGADDGAQNTENVQNSENIQNPKDCV